MDKLRGNQLLRLACVCIANQFAFILGILKEIVKECGLPLIVERGFDGFLATAESEFAPIGHFE